MIGTRVGPYEITAKLGEGGMGVVYRAKDSQLGREVALKVLPAGLTADPERLARFEREAKLLAQLNHPNIAHVYGLEGSGAARALVMELVEGPTLGERLESGPLPMEESLAIARQIAEALEAAHEKGIVHRDLKPQNIKASIDGTVKVLDFGLAKAMDATTASGPGSASRLAQSPTLTHGATMMGVILGTAAYMAPEQAKGIAVDKRADIWAFGVVLFEMLCGRPLFAGDTVTDTLAEVLKTEIDFGMLPAATPAAIRVLLRRCLERNPKNRLHDIGDARLVLDDLAAGRGDEFLAPPAPAGRQDSRRWVWWAGSLAAATVLAAGGYFAGTSSKPTARSSAATPRPIRFQQITDTPGVESSPSLSPDGKDVVFARTLAGRSDLYLQRVGGRTPVLLTADSQADDDQPAFSPGGERIAFRSERDGGGIFVMDSTGESVRRLTDFGFNPTWSPDGREIAVSEGNFVSPTDRGGSIRGMWAIDVATGARREVSRASDVMQPSWSPHGQRIAFWGLRGATGQRDLLTIAADGSEVDAAGLDVTDDTALDWSPTWSPDGRFLYFSSNRGGTMNLWRLAIDEPSGRTLGAPEPMTTPSLWSGRLSFSSDGKRLAFGSLDWRSTLLRAEFDAASGRLVGAPSPILKGTQPIRDHQLSPDGESVAYMRIGSQDDILVARVDGSQSRRLTDDAFRDRGPAWSPDGRRIAFYSDRSGSYQIWLIHPDGSGLQQVTAITDGGTANFPVWSPDGLRLAISVIPDGPLLVDLSKGTFPAPLEPLPAIAEGVVFWPLSWSANGQRLAGISVLSSGGIAGVALYDFATKSYQRLDSGDDRLWRVPVWLGDSRRLIARDSRGIWLLDPGRAAPRQLLEVGGYTIGKSVGVSRDDRWITYTETGTEGDIWLAELE